MFTLLTETFQTFILMDEDEASMTMMMLVMVVVLMMLMVVISRAFVISQLAQGTKDTKGGQMLKLHETLQFTLQSRENPPNRNKVDLQKKHCFS